ncbi:sensor histidine kinase [Flavobacterium sp. J27]|uniref:tetratricopeptide repeat-containing sensor histidine kinase n=1 Tax=Flavobacterium sp. J27 TaxID=2060419 RepID=UPI001030398B|nr:sensor histidine kinase [Flavobacterium sp. J27]
MNSFKNTIFSIAAMVIVAFSFAQNKALVLLQKSIATNNIDSSRIMINQLNKVGLSTLDKARFAYCKANYYKLLNEDDLAYTNYLEAKTTFLQLDSLSKVAKINIEITSLLLAIENNTIDYNVYINEFLEYAQQSKDTQFLSEAYMQLGKSFYNSNPNLAITYFFKALKESRLKKDVVYEARIMQNLGATYASDKILKLDSALFFYDKAMKVYEQKQLKEYISYIYINRGVVFTKQKKYEKAIASFHKADTVSVQEFKNKNKAIIYDFLANAYKESGDYKNAIAYLEKQKVYQDILDENEQKKAIIEIDTKYKTAEKEKENIALRGVVSQNKMILSILLIILFFSIVIGFLAFKNIKSKKKIVEQKKEIEVTNLVNQLKENQLHEIDKMLLVQDKERQKIADELHDNLGSLLTTLKINFETLHHTEKNTTLFDKTNQLIDEAYKEVRNIAHLKNIGVIGKEGLLVAVKKMATKMSVPNKIVFTVIPSGLHNRIDNTIEVLLFRIIQELATNCIKHAQASEVNIYMNQYDNEINIMVEDNGKGFYINNIKHNEGIGLKNMERKIEQLSGTFTIDSKIGKGTTIIIDLPL